MCVFAHGLSVGKNALAYARKCAYAYRMDSISLVEKLEARAKAVGLSLNEVCRQAGVARSTFTRWKSGDHTPTIRVLQKMDAVVSEQEAAVTEPKGGPRHPEPSPPGELQKAS